MNSLIFLEKHPPMKAKFLIPLLIFTSLATAVAFAGYELFNNILENRKTVTFTQLEGVGNLKAKQITSFLNASAHSGQVLSDLLDQPKFYQWIQNDSTEVPVLLKNLLTLAKDGEQDHGLLIFNNKAKQRYSVGKYKQLTLEGINLVNRALNEKKVILSEIYYGDIGYPNMPLLDIFYPIINKGLNETIGILIIRKNLTPLYQMIQSWPTSSQSSESLLIRRDGDDVLFLNELRFKKDTALKMRRPIESKPSPFPLPAMLAVQGFYGNIESLDYLEKPVLAHRLPIPGTTWSMVVKINTDEAYFDIQQLKELTLFVTVIIIFLLSITVTFWWHKQVATQKSIERKKAENRISAIIDSAPDAMIIVGSTGKILNTNKQSEVVFGYPQAEMIDQQIELLLPKSMHTNHIQLRNDYVKKPGSRLMSEGRVVLAQKKNGHNFEAEVSLAPVKTDNGLIIICVVRDITERKRIETKLRDAEQRFRIAFESTATGMALIGEGEHFIQYNPSLIDLLGYSGKEIEQLTFADITLAEDWEKEKELVAQLLSGKIDHYQIEKRCLHKNHEAIWVFQTRTKIALQENNLCFIVEVHDLTARKHAEEKLQRAHEVMIQTEKMAALGGLVAGVAHEINTPIGVNLASATHLQDETRIVANRYAQSELSEEGLENYFSIAEQSVQLMVINCNRAANLIQSFKQIAVDQMIDDQREFNLATYIDEVLLSLRPKFKHLPIEIMVNCADDIQVDSVPGALSQIMTNIILNALNHAFDEGQHGKIEITAQCDQNDQIKLSISDNGKGMPDSVKQKVFDPFYTTKRGTGGSGLGLNIAYNQAFQSMKGSLSMQSELNKGSRFTLIFPRIL